jgi:RNA polymerase sigma-70 factor (ECF subfamily)
LCPAKAIAGCFVFMEDRQLSRLIARVQGGESSALDQLVDEYFPRVYGFVAKMVGPGPDAEELAQEVFLRVVRTMESYHHDGKFTAWVFRIAANLVRDRVRRRKREAEMFAVDPSRGGDDEHEDPVSRAPDDGPTPSQPMETGEDLVRMRWALEQLGPEEREAILLRHYSDLPFKEIAEVMSCPLGTVLARVHRGLKHLRNLMESRAARTPR